jgi:hypothetical protein
VAAGRAGGCADPAGTRAGAGLAGHAARQLPAGAGVPGISQPGYGNETRAGLQEHADRRRWMVQRLPGLFDQPAAPGARWSWSVGQGSRGGQCRGFTRALLAVRPGLRDQVLGPSSDSYLLYFHRLLKIRRQRTPARILSRRCACRPGATARPTRLIPAVRPYRRNWHASGRIHACSRRPM